MSKLNADLNPYDMDAFPSPVEGYLDYPLLKLEC